MSDNSNMWEVMSRREYTDNKTQQQKTAWSKVGVGFTNKDGSINVQLDAIPLCGKLTLQRPLSREEREAKFGPRDGQGGRGGGPRQGQDYSNGNPRNAGAQQRKQAQQRFGQRGQSSPTQGFAGAGAVPTYVPDPAAANPANYEHGWDINGEWITDAAQLPTDHPDYDGIPF